MAHSKSYNKTNEPRPKCALCYCGDMTYICREEECWSLSNVGYGLRTRQVILAHKPLLFTVIFSVAVFPNSRGWLRSRWVARLWLMRAIWFMLQSTGTATSIWWDPRQSYIKGIRVSPQQSTAQEPSLCIALPDRCPGDCFSEPTFTGRQPDPTANSRHQRPPPSPLAIQSHLSLFQECTSATLSASFLRAVVP